MEPPQRPFVLLITATAIIWFFATGMLGICIPLVSVTHSGLTLPLAVLIIAGISTVVVWVVAGDRPLPSSSASLPSLPDMETRITTLETLYHPLHPTSQQPTPSQEGNLPTPPTPPTSPTSPTPPHPCPSESTETDP